MIKYCEGDTRDLMDGCHKLHGLDLWLSVGGTVVNAFDEVGGHMQISAITHCMSPGVSDDLPENKGGLDRPNYGNICSMLNLL